MMHAARGPTVVKLGGSHAFSPHLRDWIKMLAECSGRVVVVPGGGPFAEAVRAAQPEMRFGDPAAHHMALLAMEQYGCAIAACDARLVLASSRAAIRRRLREGRIPVWLPTAMVLAAEEIPASWNATSDSLAAWLAGRIGARRILLVKQVELKGRVRAAEMVGRDIIDPLFPRFLAASGAVAFIIGPADRAAAANAIRGDIGAGAAIDLA